MRKYGEIYILTAALCLTQIKAIRSIRLCRTPALGGKKLECEGCGKTHYVYYSCGNRNCPICQSIKKEIWIDKQLSKALPVTHYHVIFTLPHELKELILNNQRVCYGILLRSAWLSIKELCLEEKHLGAETGMIAMLHTWGSSLSFHPHVHAIVPAGGLDVKTGNWVACKEEKFFMPFGEIAEKFKEKFRQQLLIAWDNGELQFTGDAKKYEDHKELEKMFVSIKEKDWNVRVENPVLGAKQVYEYLAKYVHRPAMADSRIEKIESGEVHFTYKNYKAQEEGEPAPIETMKLPVMEFIRRFLLHVLPPGFHKVRYYGLYHPAAKQKLASARAGLPSVIPYVMRTIRAIIKKMLGHDVDTCPDCGLTGCFVTTLLSQDRFWLIDNMTFAPGRSPPDWVIERGQLQFS